MPGLVKYIEAVADSEIRAFYEKFDSFGALLQDQKESEALVCRLFADVSVKIHCVLAVTVAVCLCVVFARRHL